ncbi:MAG TPA: anion permease, partial [Myxococcaceae bacterium]|nr:anion permease [Myxococcaceae bacterium]
DSPLPSMPAAIEGSGLSSWMASHLDVVTRLSLMPQLLVATSATVFLTAVASNTATVNVMLNLLPRSMTVLSACAIASSCDFALPAGTPPNAIVFGSGYVRLPTMMRIGFTLDLLAVVLIALYGYLYVQHLF